MNLGKQISKTLTHRLGYLVAIVSAGLISGCATTTIKVIKPTPQIDTSSHSNLSPEMSGIYFYQWKTGILGSARDVSFTLDDKVLGKVNTGEWLHFEVSPGKHKYKASGGIFPIDAEIQMEAGHTYFFRGALLNLIDYAVLIRDANEIQDAFQNIVSGRYEHGDID